METDKTDRKERQTQRKVDKKDKKTERQQIDWRTACFLMRLLTEMRSRPRSSDAI